MILFCTVMDQQGALPNNSKKLIIDESVFKKIANNDLAAFEEFYHATERTVYAFVFSILKDHDAALDVLQDTYLKIRGAAHLYQPMGKPMAWVFTISRNLAMSRLRLKKGSDLTQVSDIENNISFSYISDREDRLILESAFRVLNDKEREIILLHAISGYAHNEIAKNLDMPLSTVLSKYHRGLKKLRKHIIEQGVLK